MKTFLLLLLIFPFFAAGQSAADSLALANENIIQATTYRRGIYKTFDEFKKNQPSILTDFKFDKKRLWITDGQAGSKKKLKRHEAWGFCDGSKMFIRWRKNDEILELGRYCYFKEKGTDVAFIISAFPSPILPLPLPYKREYVISYTTGKTYLLTKRYLKKLLGKHEKELLLEFKNETAKKKKLFEYIKKYNEKNTLKLFEPQE